MMVKAKIILDEKHVASAQLKDRTIHLSVNNIPKLFTSPRFIKLALSLKAVTDENKSEEKNINIKFNTGLIKSIFTR